MKNKNYTKKDIPELERKRKEMWENMLHNPELRTEKNIKKAKDLTNLIIELK